MEARKEEKNNRKEKKNMSLILSLMIFRQLWWLKICVQMYKCTQRTFMT